LAAALAASVKPAGAQCLSPAAIIAIRAVEGFPVLGATIDGIPVSFVLDTGAQADLILPEAQTVLRLPLLPGTVPLIGTGGAREAPIVRLEGVQLGAAQLDAAATPVATLPALPPVSPMLAGLLGVPLLYQFDLDLDVPAGRLTLFDAGSCAPDLGPRATSIALDITRDRRALLPVTINGVTLAALLDTGSRATLLTEAAAARLGLRAPLSANTAQGVDGELLPVAHLRVDTMAVGDDVRRNAPVSIAPLQIEDADMLLGFEYFRQRRVWISYVTARLLIVVPAPAPSAPRSPGRPPPGPARR
jgi:predicted aspartyl protease